MDNNKLLLDRLADFHKLSREGMRTAFTQVFVAMFYYFSVIGFLYSFGGKTATNEPVELVCYAIILVTFSVVGVVCILLQNLAFEQAYSDKIEHEIYHQLKAADIKIYQLREAHHYWGQAESPIWFWFPFIIFLSTIALFFILLVTYCASVVNSNWLAWFFFAFVLLMTIHGLVGFIKARELMKTEEFKPHESEFKGI
jgi:hypothetical protein